MQENKNKKENFANNNSAGNGVHIGVANFISNNSNNKTMDNYQNPSNNTKGTLESDVPLKIINAKILDDSDVNINCLIKWKPRQDSYVPGPEWISSKILKRKYPDVLFDFYESRIKFPKKENK